MRKPGYRVGRIRFTVGASQVSSADRSPYAETRDPYPRGPIYGPGVPRPSGGRGTEPPIRIFNRLLSQNRGTYGLRGRFG